MGGGIIEGVFGFMSAHGPGQAEWIVNKVCRAVFAWSGHLHDVFASRIPRKA